jgi:hypothetical protein
MHWELRMHLTKKVVNLAARVLCRFIPERKATYPQTQMLENIFAKLQRAYQIEVYAGRFDGVPYQTLQGLNDRHFQKFIEVSRKVLLYLSQDDRYYRQWLGLVMLLVKDELAENLKNLQFEDFLSLASSQWEFDMRGAISREYFEAHKQDFQNMVFANFLMNLV